MVEEDDRLTGYRRDPGTATTKDQLPHAKEKEVSFPSALDVAGLTPNPSARGRGCHLEYPFPG